MRYCFWILAFNIYHYLVFPNFPYHLPVKLLFFPLICCGGLLIRCEAFKSRWSFAKHSSTMQSCEFFDCGVCFGSFTAFVCEVINSPNRQFTRDLFVLGALQIHNVGKYRFIPRSFIILLNGIILILNSRGSGKNCTGQYAEYCYK